MFLNAQEFGVAYKEIVRARATYATLFCAAGYKVGAEVGVREGEFSERLLGRWPGVLFMIDLWRRQDPEVYDDPDNVSNEEHGDRLERARAVSLAHGGRGIIVREDSVSAAREVVQVPLDFVYIDANHSAAAVAADIQAWWPRVAPGGVLCGHDYPTTEKARRRFSGLKGVVEAFAESTGQRLRVTNEKGSASWMVRKPDPWREGAGR